MSRVVLALRSPSAQVLPVSAGTTRGSVSADRHGPVSGRPSHVALALGLGIGESYLVGLSMGATAVLEFGICHPQMALNLTVAAAASCAFRRCARPLPRASSARVCPPWRSFTAPVLRAHLPRQGTTRLGGIYVLPKSNTRNTAAVDS